MRGFARRERERGDMNPPSNLLDEALGLGHGGAIAALPAGRVVLVEDCVETSGAFVLHHLLKRALSAGEGGGDVLFLALAQPFSHYDRVLRKLGCSLSVQRNNNKLHFFDMLKLEFPGLTGGNDIESGFVGLYSKIQRAIEARRSKEYSRGCITIMIDDLSLLEIAACGSIDCVLDFLYYCISLTAELDCSLVILNHEDIYSSEEAPRFLSHLEYLADIVIKTEPLSTGLSADVHGQVCLLLLNNTIDHFQQRDFQQTWAFNEQNS
ncbi:elongator complex protein 6 isoform X2 [Phoenix dactylifera]|uniref:Elongator complex protein 6 isoform X2 n=1 Tax=Phoenix dactylifera TaxID=42345 RepID=A0A8B9A8G2_PHODC|nr:elongator complex protein 6 isoform X2 [Phoenix dactylifera]